MLRARQTAELLAAEVANGVQPEVTEGLAPKDPTNGLVSNLNAASRDLLAAGHQPFMGRCAARLLTGSEEGIRVAFRPGSIVCLER
ncbi:MAG: phosphohistidine phosphatase SixA, partial [Gammaproteobacteria bacterium]|nr:phosphohistidine phosphatase SixA [Gammaproteobacteria bacterium]